MVPILSKTHQKFNGPWVSNDDGPPSQLSIYEQIVTVLITPPFHGQVTVDILMQNCINVGMGFVFPLPLKIHRPQICNSFPRFT